MPEASRSIFNERASDKLRSPDDLDKYVQVTNPSVWVILVACIALLAGLLAWGVFGSVTTNVSATGVIANGQATCFLSADNVAKVSVGDSASIDGELVRVATVDNVPVSRKEAEEILKSDYLVSELVKGDWAYKVTFEGDTSDLTENIPLTVSITTERIAPISLILGGYA